MEWRLIIHPNGTNSLKKSDEKGEDDKEECVSIFLEFRKSFTKVAY